MKPLSFAILVAALCAPVLSNAQSAPQVTRAQVRAQVIALEKAGYNPVDDTDYPIEIQKAEAIVASQNNADSGYGPTTGTTTQSGK